MRVHLKNAYMLIVVLAFANACSALFFHIKPREVKCFLEEVPADTLIAGKYKLLILQDKEFVTAKDVGMQVDVYDPQNKVLLSRSYSSEGKFVFTTQQAGDHKICISSQAQGVNLLRVHLHLDVGDHANNYKEIATNEKLDSIQLRIRQLIDQVAMLTKDQDFQRVREEYFRRLSESINNRVTWWSVAQIILLICTGIFQMKNLRSFFLAKKLV